MRLRWLVVALLLVVAGVVGGGSGPFWGGPGVGESHTWECWEYNHDFSVGCEDPRNTDCGSRCFWPECVKCTDARHCHSCCDEDGCWTCNCHRHGVSPCVKWKWHLWQDPDGHRFWTIESPNVDSPEFVQYDQSRTECTEDGVLEELTPLGLKDREPWMQTFHDAAVPTVEFIKGLKEVPGGVGAPVLLDMELVAERWARFDVQGGITGVEKRYWVYNGFVPSEIKRPYSILADSDIYIKERGIIAFQVRSGGGLGVRSEGSNVEYLLIGLEDVKNVSQEEMDARIGFEYPPAPIPLPTIAGVTRPVSPDIVSVTPSLTWPGSYEVLVGGGYSGQLEYRVWPHSGHLPMVGVRSTDRDWREWTAVVPSDGVFLLSGLPEMPWDIQLRVVVGGIEGEPSDTFIFRVSRDDGGPESYLTGPLNYQGPGSVATPFPLPTLQGGVSRPLAPSVGWFVEVAGSPGDVEVGVSGTYFGRLEYLVWPHSGFQPAVAVNDQVPDWREWEPAVPSGGVFVVRDLEYPLIWDVQLRVVWVIEGVEVESEPSAAVSLVVLGGMNEEWVGDAYEVPMAPW